MPEYLAIGSDSDFLRIPMNLHTATAIADRFGFVLPTRKMVDAIYHQSTSRFTPQPLPAGPQMTSTEYYRQHNEMIDGQSRDPRLSVGRAGFRPQEGCRPHQSVELESGPDCDLRLASRHRRTDSASEHGTWRRLRRLQPRDSAGCRDGRDRGPAATRSGHPAGSRIRQSPQR